MRVEPWCWAMMSSISCGRPQARPISRPSLTWRLMTLAESVGESEACGLTWAI